MQQQQGSCQYIKYQNLINLPTNKNHILKGGRKNINKTDFIKNSKLIKLKGQILAHSTEYQPQLILISSSEGIEDTKMSKINLVKFIKATQNIIEIKHK